MIKHKLGLMLLTALTIVLFGQPAHANGFKYEVTITNLTQNIIFTPPLVATTRFNQDISILEVGQPASEAIAKVAEGGNTADLQSYLENKGVQNIVAHPDPILPGQPAVIEIDARVRGGLYLASMLLPTNDGFIAMNGEIIKGGFGKQTFYLKAYDAGTEFNSEVCAEIPGPQCQGDGFSEDPGEGYIVPHPGIHAEGDLSASEYQFRDPVVKVTIQRKR